MRTKIFFPALILLLLINGINSFAQVAPYTFSQSVGTYAEIAGDTIVAFATTTSGALSIDDTVYPNNFLPFTFVYNGSNFTNVVISSNGFVTFGAALPSESNFTPISTAGGGYSLTSGYGRDLIGNRGITGTRNNGSNIITGIPAAQFAGLETGRVITGTGIPAGTTITGLNSGAGTISISNNATASGTSALLAATGSIVRSTTGAAGSRVHTIQFRNVRTFATSANENCINFQIKLYETSNKIEIVYGNNKNSVSTTGQVGLRGTVNTDFNNRNTASSGWATTIPGVTNTNTLTMSAAILPVSGTIFTWTPPSILPNDVGVIAATIGGENQILSVGSSYNITATIKNFGIMTQNSFAVYYTVNGGSPVGPVNTLGPIAANGTENVTFSGGNAFTTLTPGSHTIKIYTALPFDEMTSNDTFTVVVNVQNKINTFPYIETFGNPLDWTIVVENSVGVNAIWTIALCTNPSGVTNDTAAKANYYSASSGRREILRSPVMDLSLINNPVLNFYVVYRTYQTEDDSLQVLLSSDGGVSWINASTIYNKGRSSVPSLATLAPSTAQFVPGASNQWRNETIDLSNVSGMNNVVIGFRGKSNFGNNLWIDNVIVSGSDGMCTEFIPGPGSYGCNPRVTIDFISTPLNQNQNQKKSFQTGDKKLVSNKMFSKDNSIRLFPSQNGEVNVETDNSTSTDNPTGGVVSLVEHENDNAGQNIAVNISATAPDGSTYIHKCIQYILVYDFLHGRRLYRICYLRFKYRFGSIIFLQIRMPCIS